MKIQDAKPGDVLRDKDGALWLRGAVKARCIYDHEAEPGGDSNAAEDAAEAIPIIEVEEWGPFTRLVPEHETP